MQPLTRKEVMEACDRAFTMLNEARQSASDGKLAEAIAIAANAYMVLVDVPDIASSLLRKGIKSFIVNTKASI